MAKAKAGHWTVSFDTKWGPMDTSPEEVRIKKTTNGRFVTGGGIIDDTSLKAFVSIEEVCADLLKTYGSTAEVARPRREKAAAKKKVAPKKNPAKKRTMSAAGRKAISDAAKKRWRKYRKAQKAKR